MTGGKLYFLEVVSIQKKDGGYFGVGITMPSGRLVRPVTKDHLVMYIPGNGNHIYIKENTAYALTDRLNNKGVVKKS